MTYGKKGLYTRLISVLQAPINVDELVQTIWEKQKHAWYSWLQFTFKNLSNKNTSQLFYFTLFADSRGLSISGKDLFSQLNLLLSAETFRRLLRTQMKLQYNLLQQRLQQEPFVWWFDNYNKLYVLPQFSQAKGTLKMLNWTGVVVQFLCTENSTMSSFIF